MSVFCCCRVTADGLAHQVPRCPNRMWFQVQPASDLKSQQFEIAISTLICGYEPQSRNHQLINQCRMFFFRRFQKERLKVCKTAHLHTLCAKKMRVCTLLGALSGIGGNPTFGQINYLAISALWLVLKFTTLIFQRFSGHSAAILRSALQFQIARFSCDLRSWNLNGGLANGGLRYLSTIVHDCLQLSSFLTKVPLRKGPKGHKCAQL